MEEKISEKKLREKKKWEDPWWCSRRSGDDGDVSGGDGRGIEVKEVRCMFFFLALSITK